MSIIPYGRQSVAEQDIEAVVNVLRSDWLTQGPAIETFEKAVAEYCGAKYAVAVCNATAALHIACLAAGLGEGDSLWTSPNTFVASANCGRYCGADVDFIDIDDKTYNMSIEKLQQKIAETSRGPKVLIPVHFAGQSCEMEMMSKLARQYGFTIIEDASHAIGGRYQDRPIGACQYSDMTVFSFHPVKIITTGEGGMVLTNRKDLYDKLILLRSHGITRDESLMENLSHGPWYYEQIDLGYNYRMTDMQAALGFSQLQRIDDFVQRRQALAARYNHLLANLPITLPWQNPETYSAYHLYVIRLNSNEIQKDHQLVFKELRERNIGVNLHYIPVHTQPYFRRLGFKHGDFPTAEKYYAEAISLPMYYNLSEEQQDFVVKQLVEILSS